jgi:hypothetical protein
VVLEVSASTARAVGMSSGSSGIRFATFRPDEQKLVPTVDEQELIPTGWASEVLRKFNAIPIDSCDESAFVSGLRVVCPSFA